jgi:hypothetical protein
MERARLTAPAGQMNLVSVASPGQIYFSEDGLLMQNFSQLGDIFTTDSFFGTTFIDNNQEVPSELIFGEAKIQLGGGGDICVRAHQFDFIKSRMIAATLDHESGGKIDIEVNHLKMVGNGSNTDSRNLFGLISSTRAQGTGGDILIKATETIDLSNGISIYASSGYGEVKQDKPPENPNGEPPPNGDAPSPSDKNKPGEQRERVNVTVNPSPLNKSPLGNAGNIIIETAQLQLDNAEISSETFGAGKGGNISFKINDTMTFNAAKILANSYGNLEESSGEAGEITFIGKQLSLTNSIISSSTLSHGQSGNVIFQITDAMSLSQTDIYANSGMGTFTADSEDIDTNFLPTSSSNQHPLGNAGQILVSAGQLNLDKSIISSDAFGKGEAGNITFTVQNQFLLNQTTISSNTYGSSELFAGNAGQITLASQQLEATDTIFNSSTTGSGKGGNISFAIDDTLQLSNSYIYANSGRGQVLVDNGENIQITVSALNQPPLGDAGQVSITARQLNLENHSAIQSDTYGAGKGGNVIIVAKDNISLANSSIYVNSYGNDEQATGNAGEISLNSQDVTMFASVISSSTGGIGKGGNIDFNLTGSLHLTSGSITVGSYTNLLTDTNTTQYPRGNTGDIRIRANELHLIGGHIQNNTQGSGDGGIIMIQAADAINLEPSTDDLSTISAQSESLQTDGGDAGQIWMRTPKLTIVRSIITTSTYGYGNANEIYLDIDELNLSQGAVIMSVSGGQGHASNINILAHQLLRLQDSYIATGTRQAQGGNISIHGEGLLDLTNSGITTQVQEGEGSGGQISINNADFVILDNSRVVTSAVQGNGGDITIGSKHFIKDHASNLDASSRRGVAGTVVVTSPPLHLQKLVSELPVEFIDASALIEASCAARSGEERDSLVQSGRDGLPPSPDDLQSSSLPFDAKI